MKTFCFKLYHSEHNNALMSQINTAGLVFNHCIALHKRYYRLFGKSLNANKLKVHLTKLKRTKRFAYISKLGSQAVQDIAERIDRVYTLFFANLKRKVRTSPPKFKAVRRYKSFTLKQAGWKLDETQGKIRIGKRWYRYFQSRMIQGKVKLRTGKSIGFDFGLKKFLTASDSRQPASYCEEHACICLETLNMKGMARRWGRKLHSLGFSEFLMILEYEAMKFGTQIVFIDRWYPSSQLCHVCGYKNPEVKDLKVREWDCPSCGAHHDRDRNAAINIHRAGTSTRSGDIIRPFSAGSVEDARIPCLLLSKY